MGASVTKPDSIISNRKENNNSKSAFNPADPPPVLTKNDADLLKHVWEHLKDDIHKVGVITFVK